MSLVSLRRNNLNPAQLISLPGTSIKKAQSHIHTKPKYTITETEKEDFKILFNELLTNLENGTLVKILQIPRHIKNPELYSSEERFVFRISFPQHDHQELILKCTPFFPGSHFVNYRMHKLVAKMTQCFRFTAKHCPIIKRLPILIQAVLFSNRPPEHYLQCFIEEAFEGATLAELLAKGKEDELLLELVAKTFFEKFLLGTWDGHKDNHLFTGLLNDPSTWDSMNFDFTRCFCHGNDILKSDNNRILPAFSCALLVLKQAKQPIPQEIRDKLKEMVASFEEDFPNLEEYLNTESAARKIAELPAGWFEKEKSLPCTKERISQSKTVINDPSKTNLEEMFFAMQPNYRFYIGLNLTLSILQRRSQYVNLSPEKLTSTLREQGIQLTLFNSLTVVLLKLQELGCDPLVIQNLAQETTSFDEFVNKIYSAIVEKRINNNFVDSASSIEDILLQMQKRAALDLKDQDRNTTNRKYIQNILFEFSRLGFTAEESILNAPPSPDNRLGSVLALVKETRGTKAYLVYKDVFSHDKHYTLDLLSQPGKVGIENQQGQKEYYTQEEVKETFSFVGFYDITLNEATSILKEKENTWLLTPHTDPQSVNLSWKEPGSLPKTMNIVLNAKGQFEIPGFENPDAVDKVSYLDLEIFLFDIKGLKPLTEKI